MNPLKHSCYNKNREETLIAAGTQPAFIIYNPEYSLLFTMMVPTLTIIPPLPPNPPGLGFTYLSKVQTNNTVEPELFNSYVHFLRV